MLLSEVVLCWERGTFTAENVPQTILLHPAYACSLTVIDDREVLVVFGPNMRTPRHS